MKLETFFESFAPLADAPNGVQKLRELILQLAVQGKLTRTWRAVKAISKKESWEAVDFFNFCVLQRGYDLPLSKQEEGNFPIVTSAGIAAYHSAFKAKAPGVIIGRSGSIGKVFYIEKNYWPHNTTLYVKDFKGNFPRYVYYFLLSFKAQQFSRSTAVPTLNRNNLRGLIVEVPPYEEQKQIVTRIEELMPLCDELEARQQRQQTARVKLNNAALEGLLTARAPAEFVAHWQRLCDNFDLLYDAPATVSQLRQAILQLAVQGKLVPQDSHDEPTAALLAKIKAEKERLIQEKKIRKSEPLPPIEADEVPFDLPQGWEWVRLDSVCTQITDGAHHTPNYVATGVPFLSVKDVSGGKIDLTNVRYIPKEEHDALIKRCNPEFGDLLFTKVGTTGIAKVITVEAEFSIFVSLALLKVAPGTISPQFLERVLNSPHVKKQSAKNTQGIGNKNLVLKFIKSFVLPIAPLAEQRRIVAKVDQLMALCDELEAKLRQAQTHSAKLMTATVQHLAAARAQPSS